MASELSAETDTVEDDSAFHLIAGECRVETAGATNRTFRGQVLTVVKPDHTVLVHDLDGYKPIAWLTRADTVSRDDDAGHLTAVDGDQWLHVAIENEIFEQRVPGSAAGEPIGECPQCDGHLVFTNRTVHCLGCRDRFRLPAGATLLEETCTCGLPHMRIERGDVFDLCIDRSCEPMAEAIADRFDHEWACPESGCNGYLRVIHRGKLLAGCDQYPECDAAFRLPHGLLDGYCSCGLPRFDENGELRCLDLGCDVTG